jgi:hypothetical protein
MRRTSRPARFYFVLDRFSRNARRGVDDDGRQTGYLVGSSRGAAGCDETGDRTSTPPADRR